MAENTSQDRVNTDGRKGQTRPGRCHRRLWSGQRREAIRCPESTRRGK